jgi:hypothetical protein
MNESRTALCALTRKIAPEVDLQMGSEITLDFDKHKLGCTDFTIQPWKKFFCNHQNIRNYCIIYIRKLFCNFHFVGVTKF